ncbi:MAG TPA: glycosyltransferase [Desulfobacteraceae bacterium]|nr:glycosyltransferase [Desulfobacteraceae bacterium]
MPKVSVIIPAYNHERFVGAAVESVLDQSHGNFELIVINDGSTDRTGEVVQSYRDDRLTYLYQDNQDAYNTINRGLSLGTGEYIAILNSDDVYFPDRLRRLIAEQQATGAHCLFTDVVPVSDEGVEFTDPEFGWNVWHRKNREFHRECGDLYAAFLKGNFMVTTSNLFMTAEAARKVGRFSSLRYLHDYDYIFRMMLAYPGKVRYLADEKLLYYRIHSGNTLSEAAITGREQDRELIRKYMLAAIPEESRPFAAAGADRLVELERELQEVRSALAGNMSPGVKNLARQLAAALRDKIRKTLGRTR